jgi:hypothetical protein
MFFMKFPTLLVLAATACLFSALAETAPPAGGRTLYDFQKGADTEGWMVENDGVMGGLSKGTFRLNSEGHGEFTGIVSLDNDGGFASVQWNFDPIDVSRYTHFVLRLRGDGKRYLLLTEAQQRDKHYYQAEFQTGTDWQTVEIPFSSMVPHFRGDQLDQPNFPGTTTAQVRIMVANKKAESFQLEIDRIGVR